MLLKLNICLYPHATYRKADIPDQSEILANDHNINRVKTYKSLGIELDELFMA